MTVSFIIQMAGGVVGSNLLIALFKRLDLGSWGNSVCGIIDGTFCGQLFQQCAGLGIDQVNLQSVIANIISGSSGGVLVMLLAGLINSIRSRRP